MLAVSVTMFAVYADYIAPLFDTFVPLPPGELRDRIEALAARLDFPLTKLYVVKGSVRSSHSNAYFYGFFKNKRIVLFDTLLPPGMEIDDAASTGTDSGRPAEGADADADGAGAGDADAGGGGVGAGGGGRIGAGAGNGDGNADAVADGDAGCDPTKETKRTGCSVPEIVAVLSHELGHWSHNHVLKGFVTGQLQMLIMMYTFNNLAANPRLYQVRPSCTTRPSHPACDPSIPFG